MRALLYRTRVEWESRTWPVYVASPLSQKHLWLPSTHNVAGGPDCRAERRAAAGNPGGSKPFCPLHLGTGVTKENAGSEALLTERQRQGKVSHYSVPWSLGDGWSARATSPLLRHSRRTPLPRRLKHSKLGLCQRAPRTHHTRRQNGGALPETHVREGGPKRGDEPGSGCVCPSWEGSDAGTRFLRTWPSGAQRLPHETAFPNTEELNLSFYFILIRLNANMHV